MAPQKPQIMATTTHLLLEEGVRVTTAKIAKEAGVANGTLFNLFPTKQTLFDEIYVDAKTTMFAAIPNFGDAPFDREALRENWDGYFDWASARPETRRAMNLLLDAGLVSAAAQQETLKISEPHAAWLQSALESGVIRAPSVSFVGKLISFHLDLVINEGLEPKAADLAFDMLCSSLGLTE